MDHSDDQVPSRLNAMLARIATLPLKQEDGHLDLARRRSDIAKAVELLVELYGEQAMDRATLLERQSVVSGFARSVREALAIKMDATAGTQRSLKTS
jgi:hypothetical protein